MVSKAPEATAATNRGSLPDKVAAIRVMGPCIAMGTAAAHALDLAGSGPVHQIDFETFQKRLTDNLDRCD